VLSDDGFESVLLELLLDLPNAFLPKCQKKPYNAGNLNQDEPKA
jgi:hypothetical protein